MSAAETIKAAIDKLEALKAKSAPGPWSATRDDASLVWLVSSPETIDAQLAVLRTGLTLATTFPKSEWTNTVNLARAILGGDS